MIPLIESYSILPSTDRSKTKFSFKAQHAQHTSFIFAAETQLGMVSWINVMVKASTGSKLLFYFLIYFFLIDIPLELDEIFFDNNVM